MKPSNCSFVRWVNDTEGYNSCPAVVSWGVEALEDQGCPTDCPIVKLTYRAACLQGENEDQWEKIYENEKEIAELKEKVGE
jgi:hypothetical protein